MTTQFFIFPEIDGEVWNIDYYFPRNWWGISNHHPLIDELVYFSEGWRKTKTTWIISSVWKYHINHSQYFHGFWGTLTKAEKGISLKYCTSNTIGESPTSKTIAESQYLCYSKSNFKHDPFSNIPFRTWSRDEYIYIYIHMCIYIYIYIYIYLSLYLYISKSICRPLPPTPCPQHTIPFAWICMLVYSI